MPTATAKMMWDNYNKKCKWKNIILKCKFTEEYKYKC